MYKYLESMMTCARVREFNSKPPPEVTIEPKIVDAPTPNTSAKPESATTEDLPKMYYRTLLNHKTAGGQPMQIHSTYKIVCAINISTAS